MRLIEYNDYLLYFFTDKDGRVELSAGALVGRDTEFRYSERDRTLTFDIGATTYMITAEGIVVTTPSRRYDMKAVADTRKGSLSKIPGYDFNNVTIY
jgi:hypothetical protein